MATIVGPRRDPDVHRLLEIVLDDQKSAWTRGERTSVEVFLARYPRLRDDAEAVLDLIYQEQVIRQELGETLSLEEFLARFPDRSESLMLQFAADQAVPSSEFSTQVQTFSPVDRRDHPTTFGAYEVVGVLGRGGMGVVYKAYDKNLKRFVALKTIAGGRHADLKHRQRFEIEAHAVARLQHSNILQIHEINEHEGCPYIVLEYAPGGSLADKITDKPQPHHAVAAIIETLARAIHVAHGQGIIHRDLKPSNILLTADKVYKISDFGLAKLLDDESLRTQSGDYVGTPSFMAPEQAEGHSHSKPIGPTADIYSLGAILYQALTGRPPFLGGSAIETIKQVVGTEVVPPRRLRPGVPRDLETICLKCLEKAPANRYATALELAEDLSRFQCGATILARRSGVVHRSWKWTKRHPWQTTSALLLFVGSLTLAGFFYWHNRLLRAEIGRTQAKTDEAHRNYQEARSTIETMLSLLEKPRIEGVPRLMELRHDQRQAALTFYERILRDIDSNDSVVLMDMILALGQASMLQHQLGHTDRAKEDMDRALSLIERLRTKRPDAIKFLRLEIDTLMKLGNYTLWLGQSDRSMDWLRRSMELAERLVGLAPDDPSDQDLLAVCYNSYAGALNGSSRKAEALVYYQKSTAVREHIDPSKLPGITIRIAQTLINEGVILWHLSRNKDAEERFLRAEKILLSVPADQGDIYHNIGDTFGELNISLSGMLLQSGRFREVIARTDAGLSRLEPYLKTEPNHAVARDECLKLHGNRAYALSGLGKHRESAAEWTRVVELSPEPVPAEYRIWLAHELIQAGEQARALAQAQLVQATPNITPDQFYNLGCLFALAAAAASKDSNVSPAERVRLVDSHISEAMRWLRSAANAGLFHNPAMRDQALKDTDLSILAGRDEFRKLIEADGTKSAGKGK